MKNVLLAIIISLSLTLVGCFQTQPLQLSIESDKRVYTTGDEIAIYCKVENVSGKVVNFYSAYRPELDFKVSYGDGKNCPTASAPQTTGNNSLISLEPKESFSYSISGKIIEGKGRFSTEGKYKEFVEVEGIFLYFPAKGKVHLENGFAVYNIEAYYEDGSSWEYLRSNYTVEKNQIVYPPELYERLKDKWKGKLASNVITIEVKEQNKR